MFNKSLNFAIIVTFLAPATAYANEDTNAWEGLSLQAGVNYRASTVKSHSLSVAGSFDLETDLPFNKTGTPTSRATSETLFASLSAGYTFAVNDKIVLTIGGEFTPGDSTSDDVSSSFDIINLPGGSNHEFAPISWQYRTETQFSLFAAPGYAISDTQLAYLKAGYSRQRAHLETVNGNNLGSKNVGGFLLGAGYKNFVSGGLFVFGEANVAFYDRANFAKDLPVSNTNLMVDDKFTLASKPESHAVNMVFGLGYKF